MCCVQGHMKWRCFNLLFFCKGQIQIARYKTSFEERGMKGHPFFFKARYIVCRIISHLTQTVNQLKAANNSHSCPNV